MGKSICLCLWTFWIIYHYQEVFRFIGYRHLVSQAYPGTDTQIAGFISQKDVNGEVITVDQPMSTSGGYGKPDLMSLKGKARRQAQTLGRYITLDDYKNGVDTEPYVDKFVVKDWKSPSYVNLPYLVKIWALNHSGDNLNQIDINTLKSKFYAKGVTDVEIIYMETSKVKIRIDINLCLKVSSESNQALIRDAVKGGMQELLNYNNSEYGQNIYLINLEASAKSISSYIKSAHVNMYIGSEVNILDYQGYEDLDLSSIDIYHGMPMSDLKAEVDKVHKIVDHGLVEVSDDYNIGTVETYKDLSVITWKEVGDISLDDIEFPDIYRINVTSTQEDSEVEL